MPNWCNNTIEITGPKDKIQALYQGATAEDGGLLNTMVPMPEGLRDTVAPAPRDSEQPVIDGFDNWYDWSVARWGTKWDVSPEGLEFIENQDGTATLSGWFDSAWAPPMTACERFCTDNPDVQITLDYHEPGMCFVGRAEYADGDLVDDTYYDYGEFTSKTVRDAIGAEMDDYWAISENMAEWEEENEEA